MLYIRREYNKRLGLKGEIKAIECMYKYRDSKYGDIVYLPIIRMSGKLGKKLEAESFEKKIFDNLEFLKSEGKFSQTKWEF